MDARRGRAHIAEGPGIAPRGVDAARVTGSPGETGQQELTALRPGLVAVEATYHPLDIVRAPQHLAQGRRVVMRSPLHHAPSRSMSSAMIAAIAACSSAGMKRA